MANCLGCKLEFGKPRNVSSAHHTPHPPPIPQTNNRCSLPKSDSSHRSLHCSRGQELFGTFYFPCPGAAAFVLAWKWVWSPGEVTASANDTASTIPTTTYPITCKIWRVRLIIAIIRVLPQGTGGAIAFPFRVLAPFFCPAPFAGM